LSARFQDIKETIAQVLIPVFARLLEVAEPVITTFFDWIKAMINGERSTGKLSGVLKVLWVIVSNVYKVWSQFYGVLFQVGSYLYDKLSPALSFVGGLLVDFYNTIVKGVNKFNELLGFELRLEEIDLTEVDKQLDDKQKELDEKPLKVKVQTDTGGDTGDLSGGNKTGGLTDREKERIRKKAEAEQKIINEAKQRYEQGEVDRLGIIPRAEEIKRREIDVEKDFIGTVEDMHRQSFANRILNEQDFELQKLELKRQTLEQEIEILREGTDADIAEAYRKYLQVKELDDQITEKKIENAEREAAVKRELNQITLDTATDALAVGAELLAQDEAARKKNASAIKAFQSGQVIVSGISEVQKIWEKSAEFGPFGAAIAAIQTAVAIGRTTAALNRIASTKFARGGIFGGRPHSAGGTRGYFDDGTQIEVEKDEMFAIINKRSTGLLRRLSAINQAGGGVPLMERGGVFAAGGVPDTSPAGIDLSVLTAGGTPDYGPILAEITAMRNAFEQFPRTLNAKVVYGEYESVADDVSDVQNAANL